jgi:hypothetical protein
MAGAIAKANDPLTKAKRQTYEGFTRFVLWGTVIVITIVALMGIFVA